MYLRDKKKQVYHGIHVVLRFINDSGVLRGSVVKCLTCNPGVLGSSRTGSSGYFVGVSLGTSKPQPSAGETQERHE